MMKTGTNITKLTAVAAAALFTTANAQTFACPGADAQRSWFSPTGRAHKNKSPSVKCGWVVHLIAVIWLGLLAPANSQVHWLAQAQGVPSPSDGLCTSVVHVDPGDTVV